MKKLSILTAVVFLSILFQVHNAAANELVTCKVLTIEASNTGHGIDKALEQYASIFKKKPFHSFNSFTLVSENEYQLELNSPTQLELPRQLSGTLEFSGKNNSQLTLNLNLSNNNEPPIVIKGTASNGVPFMAAGFKSPHGRWVIAIKCSK